MTDIERMLRDGKTPNELIEEINEAQRRIEEDKAKAENKNVLRENAVDAIMDYLDVIAEAELTDQEYEDLWDEVNKVLKEMEQMADSMKKKAKKVKKPTHAQYIIDDDEEWERLLKLFI